MKHILHALDLVGPDHVGIGADWDGGGGVDGLNDVTALPKITDRLLKAGYTEAQLANFWGGNALRVLGKAHAARKQA
jgi:membrane dipeptidase